MYGVLVHALGKIGMIKNNQFWKNKKVLITGHTGFKGSWLSIILNLLSAKVYGYALSPEKNSLFKKAKINKLFEQSHIGNIKKLKNLQKTLKSIEPEIIFHMAAQPLVVQSYKNPKDTFETNIIGTVNLLESAKELKKLKVIIVVTTDKVYKILKNNPAYNEEHQLGASDPYATSKTCAELIAECYCKSFLNLKKKIIVVSVRAGNVIGGGDYSENRIVPDFIESLNKKKKLIIRNPDHVRPWQHVLEPLFGYVTLAEKLYKKRLNNKYESWNFAPHKDSFLKVRKLIELFQSSKYLKKQKIKIVYKKKVSKFKETNILKLDFKKSFITLKWKPRFTIKETVNLILQWNHDTQKKAFYLEACKKQIFHYLTK